MSRYIDADLIEYHDSFTNDGEFKRIAFGDDIDILPTGDVVEVVRGEWIDTNPNDPLDPRVTCSICGDTEVIFKGNFCPNCGADMRGDIT